MSDLDIPPAAHNRRTIAGRIHVDAKTQVHFATKDKITPVLLDGNNVVAQNRVERADWYAIAVDTPLQETAFELAVTYTAPAKL